MDNIFMADRKPIQFEEYLKYDENSRGNLGEELPVRVYRLLEYSLKEELLRRYGKDEQVEVFRSAGRMAGEYFAKNMLNLDQPMDQFVSELQNKMKELKNRSGKLSFPRWKSCAKDGGNISTKPYSRSTRHVTPKKNLPAAVRNSSQPARTGRSRKNSFSFIGSTLTSVEPSTMTRSSPK